MKYTSKLILNGEEYQFAAPEQGRQPGANTVAYYPLDSTDTYYDKSGNNRNLTVYQTPVYQSNYTDLTNGCFAIPNMTLDHFTFCFWAKRNSINGNYLFDSVANSKVLARIQYTSGSITFASDFPSYTGELSLTNDTDWHLYTVVRDDNGWVLYLDGNSFSSRTFSGSLTTNGMRIGTEWNSTSTQNPNIYVSKFIIEDKARTAQEVSDYFNQTKSLYGIS